MPDPEAQREAAKREEGAHPPVPDRDAVDAARRGTVITSEQAKIAADIIRGKSDLADGDAARDDLLDALDAMANGD